MVHIDPSYYSSHSDNEYARRYHFVEGSARDWQGVDIQQHTKTRQFKNYPTPFSPQTETYEPLNKLFRRHRNSILVVSYSSNSLPTLEEMAVPLRRYKRHVDIVPVDYRYSIGNQGRKAADNNNEVLEYLFVGH